MRRSFLIALALAASSTAFAVPTQFQHQGRLHDALGDPLTGFNSVTLSLHDAPAGGSALWAETHNPDFDNGYYAVTMGSLQALDPDEFDVDNLYIAIAVNGGAPLPDRVKLNSVPFAFRALNATTATNVVGGTVDVNEIRINGAVVIGSSGVPNVNWSDIQGMPSDFADGVDDAFTPPSCNADELMLFNGVTWECAGANDHGHSADDISSGTISPDRLDFGTGPDQVAAGDHSHGGGGGGALLLNFELDESGSTFTDTSGSGQDAGSSGGGLTSGSTGHSGKGVDFSGGVITIGAGNTVPDSPHVTAEAWIKPDTPLSGTHVVFMKEGAFKLQQDGDAMTFTVDAVNGSCTVTGTTGLTAGVWSHVSGTYNGRSIRVSVDDYWLEAPCTEGPVAVQAGGKFHIGADATSGSANDAFLGGVDEVRMWSIAQDSGYSRYGVTGGIITEVDDDRIHTFLDDGTFTTQVPLTVEVLVIAGGGGGGQHSTTNGNGGGGAGGVIHRDSFSVSPGTYDIQVGRGGGAQKTNHLGRVGGNGENSSFSSLTAIGGGGGGAQSTGNGRSGGSGGGGASNGNPTPGNGTSGQGNAGGSGNYTWTGGGGGGAGGPGINGNACGNCAPSGNGGQGLSFDISGETKWYAGGGGGGGNSSERAGDGYHGGGRGYGTTSHYNYRMHVDEVNSSTLGSGTVNAIPNTGGGGGAGSYWAANAGWFGAGNGGSGIVIIRYSL